MDQTAPPPSRRRPGLRRRQVLVSAGLAAGALGATRVLGLNTLGIPGITGAAALEGATVATKDWASPLNQPDAQVGHLLRRTTFGATKAQLDAARADGFRRTVDKLIETPAAAPKELAGADVATQEKPINPAVLQTWWIDQMLATPTPFAERMAFFWHGHFTSDFRKVSGQLPYLYWQNQTWRKMALGDFRDMVLQVTTDPAMLRYLDLSQSTGKSPNENYSRELMELFTMGVGTFTEDDVRGGAKALAGWREPVTQAMSDYQLKKALERNPKAKAITPDTVKTGVFEKARAYTGAVAFLGETRQWTIEAVVDKILTQDSVAPYITTKILREFVTPDPSEAYVKRIADGWRKSRYDTKTLMRDVLTSPEFLAPASYRALVKSPTEFMLHVARALEMPSLSKNIAQTGASMGQSLYDPPEVGGWPSNASWVSSANVLARVNFIVMTLTGMAKTPAFANAHQSLIEGTVGPKTADLLNAANDDQTRWLILLASPEFQLK
ncbi:MAG: hypothetical protein NVSMB8_06610 [Candidatus Limnocylindrales bacterium]